NRTADASLFRAALSQKQTTQSIVERSIPGTAHFSQVRTSRTPSCSPPQAEVYQSQEANATCRYHVADITSSIRPLYPAAFRTDATPAKESVPCTFDRDQTHTDTSGSSSTDRFASLLVRVRRGGTAGIVGRSSPASGTLSVGLIACAAKLQAPRSVPSPSPRPDPAPVPDKCA